MRYLSVCSGIEGASLAWRDLGWEPVAFAEIEPFACAVLRHHYPNVPNLGDFTKIGAEDVGPVDLIIGGTPCQDFSVAGLRAGLTGDRGGLTVEFVHLLERVRPRWFIWENVPGVLSADGGGAFGIFLGLLAQCGYGFAHRIYDARFFGIPQRRRRVFVVGHLGDWRRPAAVLFEPDGLRRHLASSSSAGTDSADDACEGADRDGDSSLLEAGAPAGDRADAAARRPSARARNVITPSLTSSGAGVSRVKGAARSDDAEWFAATLQAHADRQWIDSPMVVQPEAAQCNGSNVGDLGTLRAGNGNEAGGVPFVAFTTQQEPKARADGAAFALTADSPSGGGQRQCIAFDTTQMTSAENRNNPKAGDPCHPLAAGAHPPAIAFSCKDYGQDVSTDESPTLRSMNEVDGNANGGGQVAVAFEPRYFSDREKAGGAPDGYPALTASASKVGDGAPHVAIAHALRAEGFDASEDGTGRGTPIISFTERGRAEGRNVETQSDLAYCLRNPGGGGGGSSRGSVGTGNVVRRLMPRECERLQGVDDDYTLVPYRYGRLAADGPRYRALGNGFPVPVIRFLGERIDAVEDLCKSFTS